MISSEIDVHNTGAARLVGHKGATGELEQIDEYGSQTQKKLYEQQF